MASLSYLINVLLLGYGMQRVKENNCGQAASVCAPQVHFQGNS